MNSDDFALKQLCELWVTKIRRSLEHKKKRFQDDADSAMQFFNGPHDFMYEEMKGDDVPMPAFRMTYNKIAEFVQIYGPALYHTNPNREVSPREPLDLPFEVFGNPMIAQAFAQQDGQRSQFDSVRAYIMERVLNWGPASTDLRMEARMAVDEALIKGRSCLWTELWQPPGAQFKVAGSFHDSVDNLAIDPDMEKLTDSQWIARRCTHPTWLVEREYNLRPGSLRSNKTSEAQAAFSEQNSDVAQDRRRWSSNDLITYWKIYSRMGIGARLCDGIEHMNYGGSIDIFGDYVFLVVAPGIGYPLNLPPDLQEAPGADGSDPRVVQRIIKALQWPIPTWAGGQWPVSLLDFHKIPKMVWPMSHLKPGMGEIKFLNWVYSFVAGKIKNVSRDFVAVLKEVAEEVKVAILSGQDMTMIELETQYPDIAKVVQFLRQPEFNPSIWDVVRAVEANLEKRLGLNEMSYGQTNKQIRSAAEADIKNQGTAIRPDDMAEQVESWMTEASRKEGMAARLYLRGTDVKPVLGDLGAMFWDQFVATDDPQEAAHEFTYRIESGSVRKPNRERDAANFQAGMQILLPVFQSFAAATGNVGPINALIKGWCQSRGMDDFRDFLLPPPAPPPLPGAPPGAPPGPPGLPGPGMAPPMLPAPR